MAHGFDDASSNGSALVAIAHALEAIADAQTVLAFQSLRGFSVDESAAGTRVRKRFLQK